MTRTQQGRTRTDRRATVLFLHAGGERYALDVGGVVEVVPLVPLRAVPQAPEAVAGMVDYRGHVVPVLDLARHLGFGPTAVRLSSRIVVVDLARLGVVPDDAPSTRRLLGIAGERVLEVGTIDVDAEAAHPGPKTPKAPALGRLLATDEGLVQWIDPRRLLSPDLLASLHAGNAPEEA